MSRLPTTRRLLLALALTAIAAATSSCRWPMPACPDKGGPTWWHVEVPHFEVWTDLDDDVADLVAYDLERERAALVAAAWSSVVDRGGKLGAIILRDDELTTFMDNKGVFVSGAGVHEGLIVATGDVTGRIFKHELGHALSRQYGLPDTAPLWLAEGLACYLESTTYRSPAGQLRVGDPGPFYADQALASRRSFRVLREGNELTRAFYPTSWLLVHFLISTRPEELLRFQELLAQGIHQDPAWTMAFPDLAPEQVDAALTDYIHNESYAAKQRPWTPPPVTPTRTAMPDADAHAVRALLIASAARAMSKGDRKKKATDEVAESLRQDPDNHLALLVRHRFFSGPPVPGTVPPPAPARPRSSPATPPVPSPQPLPQNPAPTPPPPPSPAPPSSSPDRPASGGTPTQTMGVARKKTHVTLNFSSACEIPARLISQ